MERITLRLRTSKTKGSIKIRFRLSDTRAVDLYHKSSIVADLKDLEKFNMDGSLKPKVSIFNKQLKIDIDRTIKAMSQAYHHLCEKMDRTHISGELFEKEVEKILNPEGEEEKKEIKKESMLNRFSRFIESGYKDNLFGDTRKRNYELVLGSLDRYLTIKHLKRISADEFTSDMLAGFQSFIINEYKYIDKYPKLFAHLNQRRLPQGPREENTVAMRMKMIQAFFNELLEQEEVEVSPFYKLGRKRKANMLREQYEDPKFLRKDEFLKILNAEVPDNLKEVRAAFLLQCSFGCRISDFQTMSMSKVSVSEDGIPYIHYLPQKTRRTNVKKEEIETPILKFALDIIKEWQFQFPLLKYAGGERGYNAKIKKLLEFCGIDREVKTYDDERQENVWQPLYEFGSSKLCRSTHVDMTSKIQVNLYASGLHHEGSNAVHHYTKLELRDRFILLCAAFDQPQYKVDKDLNIIEEN